MRLTVHPISFCPKIGIVFIARIPLPYLNTNKINRFNGIQVGELGTKINADGINKNLLFVLIGVAKKLLFYCKGILITLLFITVKMINFRSEMNSKLE